MKNQVFVGFSAWVCYGVLRRCFENPLWASGSEYNFWLLWRGWPLVHWNKRERHVWSEEYVFNMHISIRTTTRRICLVAKRTKMQIFQFVIIEKCVINFNEIFSIYVIGHGFQRISYLRCYFCENKSFLYGFRLVWQPCLLIEI